MSVVEDQPMDGAQGPSDSVGGLEVLGSFVAVHYDDFVKVVPKKELAERSAALVLRAKNAGVSAKQFTDSVKDFVGMTVFKDVVRLVAACELFHGTLLELPAGTWARDGSVDGKYRKIFEESDAVEPDPDKSSDGEVESKRSCIEGLH